MAASPVTALIGTRAYRHGRVPQGAVAPYVAWSAFGTAENAFDGAAADVWRVQVDCWSDTDDGVEQLARAVRAAIEPHAHLQSYTNDEQDERTKRYRFGMAFDWIDSR